MGTVKREWQDTGEILRYFGKGKKTMGTLVQIQLDIEKGKE